MRRFFALSLMTSALMAPTASAQDGILGRTGRALDNAGRGIRNAVEAGVARGQIDAEDREVLARVMRRVEWDAPLVGSTISFEVQPGRVVILRGSVPSAVHKQRAAALVSSTVGVAGVVDELAVVKGARVIQAKPAARAVGVAPPVVTETRVIVKPRDQD